MAKLDKKRTNGQHNDETAWRAVLESLRADRDEAKAASRAKTAFLASISHELRTPLNGIIGFAEMIAAEQLGPISDKRYPGYANDIVASARRLLHVLSDILDMARLEGGRAEVIRAGFALPDLAEETLVLLRERVPPRGPQVRVSIEKDFPVLWTDRRHLRQILVNLLTNAVTFTAEDGTVELSARTGSEGEVEIRVADSGVGMSPEEMKRAVTRFGQAEPVLSRSHQGIGLGLPLAKSLTELLGGTLAIQSERGKGTTVTIAFPRNAIKEGAFEWKRPPDRMAERARKFMEKQASGA